MKPSWCMRARATAAKEKEEKKKAAPSEYNVVMVSSEKNRTYTHIGLNRNKLK